MSELKITKDSIQNAILKDGQFVYGSVTENNSSIYSSGAGSFAHGVATSGNSCGASGSGSMASGENAKATNNSAHALGKGVLADKDSLTVIGSYNAATSNGDLFVIGNGTSSSKSTCFNINAITNSGYVKFKGNTRFSIISDDGSTASLYLLRKTDSDDWVDYEMAVGNDAILHFYKNKNTTKTELMRMSSDYVYVDDLRCNDASISNANINNASINNASINNANINSLYADAMSGPMYQIKDGRIITDAKTKINSITLGDHSGAYTVYKKTDLLNIETSLLTKYAKIISFDSITKGDTNVFFKDDVFNAGDICHLVNNTDIVFNIHGEGDDPGGYKNLTAGQEMMIIFMHKSFRYNFYVTDDSGESKICRGWFLLDQR